MIERQNVPGSMINRAAGVLLVAIGCLHVAFMAPHPYWPQWLSGGLRADTTNTESFLAFWALPGSFAIPLLLLGLVIIRLASNGSVPGFLGWVLFGWALTCVLLISPASGFSLILVPAALLVVAQLRQAASHPRSPASVGQDHRQ